MADIQHKDITGSDAIHPNDFYQSSDPGAVGANKSWKDTSTSPPTFKRRNTGDIGWDTVLDPTTFVTKTTLTTLGDIFYASAANIPARLAGNITTTRKFLRQTGSGAASAAPAWDTLVAGDIPVLDASKITTGTFSSGQIPNLAASIITSGVFGASRIPGLSESYYENISGGPLDIWYILGANNNASSVTGAVTANTLYAVPFVASHRGPTLDRLAFNVTTALAGNARVGIYDSTSGTNLYPNNLVIDGGSISTGTTGIKSTSISQALTAGALYWAVYVGDAAATVRCHQAGTGNGVLGIDSSLPGGSNRGINVAFTFAALPSTFPGSATLITTGSTTPMVFGRYSA